MSTNASPTNGRDPAGNRADVPSNQWPETPSYWQFVPIGDYQVPALPARGAMSEAWTQFKRALRRIDDESLQPARKEAQLRALSEVRLSHLVPPVDPNDPADALDGALYDWMTGHDERPVRFVVGQPHGCYPQLLPFWAQRHGARLIDPPDPETLLEGDLGVLDRFEVDRPGTRAGNGGMWVIPDLAHWYLRHPEGLRLVRALLARAETGELGRGIIGCDSWAWAYLGHLWPMPHHDALTAQGFDGTRLTRLLFHQIERQPHRRVHFRNAANGQDILAVPSNGNGNGVTAHPELQRLAAHCRGNPGTALTYWRESLRTEPDDGGVTAVEGEQRNDDIFDEEDVWVTNQLHEPILPNETGEDVALVLHALLLHNGLATRWLAELLPLARDVSLAILLRLTRAGLVTRRGDRHIVTALGYQSVRSLLQRRDYLTDSF